MTKTYDHVDVDLTALRKLACGLVPDIPIEFELVPLYSYVNKSNQFDKFTTIFLKKMYGIEDNKNTIKTLNKFMKYNTFLSIVNKFVEFIEIIVLKSIDDITTVIDINFDSIILDTDMYLVRFKITRGS